VCRNSLRRDQQQQNITYTFPFHHIMTTLTPSNSPKGREYDTIKRARFFETYDSKENDVGVARVCRKLDFDLPPSTARL
jgi:hypothetical protein